MKYEYFRENFSQTVFRMRNQFGLGSIYQHILQSLRIYISIQYLDFAQFKLQFQLDLRLVLLYNSPTSQPPHLTAKVVELEQLQLLTSNITSNLT